MSKFPTAIQKPLQAHECNFVQINLNNNHLYFNDFLIETNHKLIESKIAIFLGINEELVEEQAVTIRLEKWIYGRCNCIKGLTLEQVLHLFKTTSNARADVYKPILSELFFTQVIPLFNGSVAPYQAEVIDIEPTPPAPEKREMMTSLEISTLTGKQHNNVMRDISLLISELGGQLRIEPSYYVNKQNKKQPCFTLDREATLLLTSGYSVQIRLKIIRRLDELENKLKTPLPTHEEKTTDQTPLALPQNYKQALLALVAKEEQNEQLTHERDEAIRTKAMISDKQTATALSKAGVLTRRVKQLEHIICKMSELPDNKYATVLAIQSRMKHIKVSGLKLTYYCQKHGLVMKDVQDDRFGLVHSYPAEAWKEVYQIDINNVLNKVA